ncbi:response regulator transcription factor [Haliscomenobacter hydrossis]|uniref:Two component transcriptional regulator, winged helix family n=1 Tax=Haliscomenobacter hydrossis (strain ATCC 27775 / DSM 1100 / LMG 10767 / O) TaxID=760192 RepID=F4L4Z7_HALH1|nr:response regulator transcription factor [Haliscomenobacter hydrossis]AEE54059.1 two component transcriptional regulator, winged helix family [Haliscomenobacter hydrossis DSM 1100]
MAHKGNVLIVEDDLSLGFLLMELLESEGYSVKLARNGQTGLEQFKKQAFDLCILDVMLGDTDGFQVAKQIRLENTQIPFLFLTARVLKEDRLKGYALGAEDYITKPFEEEELLCKIAVILRRSLHQTVEEPQAQFSIGDYYFDYTKQELVYQNQIERITEKENEVLRLLCLHQNNILRRDDAVERIYGEKDYFLGRSFDVFISRLRKMLRNDPRISIENVFKVGFILKIKE